MLQTVAFIKKTLSLRLNLIDYGDSLSSFAALSCYNEQLNKKVRVAAHSALELFGFNHYVPMGKPLLMVAYHNSNIPKWMTSDSFDKNFKPFSTKMIDVPQTSTVQIEGIDVLVSSPEQAFMEWPTRHRAIEAILWEIIFCLIL